MTRERFVALTIWAHLLVASVHGVAHGALAIPLRGPADTIFVAATVYAGPLVALAALRKGAKTPGAVLLTISMAAALGYGLAFHYVLPTADRVATVPPGLWGLTFGVSAALIAVLETLGLATGLLMLVLPATVDA